MAWGKPPKSVKFPSKPMMAPGTATTTSTVKNSSNSGASSSHSASSGATGSVTNTTNYGTTVESDYIKNMRKMMGL